MSRFSADDALRLGGWHPLHARVLSLQVQGDAAVAVIDSNGDGTHIDVEWYECDDGTWAVTDSWTDVRPSDVRQLLHE